MKAKIVQEMYKVSDVREVYGNELIPENTRRVTVIYDDNRAVKKIYFEKLGGGLTGHSPSTLEARIKVAEFLKKLSSENL